MNFCHFLYMNGVIESNIFKKKIPTFRNTDYSDKSKAKVQGTYQSVKNGMKSLSKPYSQALREIKRRQPIFEKP